MAVYTHLAQAELKQFVERHYALGNFVRATGIAAGVSNSNYRLETTQGAFILTLYETATQTDDLPFFLGLMQHLALRGIPCPQPVARNDGAWFGPLAQKMAAIVGSLPGGSKTHASPVHTARVGTLLATLHQAGQDFPLQRANGLGLERWWRLYQMLEPRLDTITPNLAKTIRHELEYLQAHWPSDSLPHGVIHADLFPDNVFFVRETLSGVIDFYFACSDRLAYDLAITLNAWCFTPDAALEPEKAESLVRAYHAARPLHAYEQSALPVLLRGAAMRFLLTRAHAWLHHDPKALVTPHDPMHYLRILHVHQRGEWQMDRGS